MGYGFDGLGLVCLLGLAVGPLFHFCTIDPTQTTARATSPEYQASAEG